MSDIKEFDIKNLQRAWGISLILGGLGFLASLLIWEQFSDPDIITIVIIFAVSAIIFSAAFFFLCLIFSPGLGAFIQSDDTQIKGPKVEMVTTIEPSGDADIDLWVQRYAFTRNMFGLSIIPLLILGGLFVFG